MLTTYTTKYVKFTIQSFAEAYERTEIIGLRDFIDYTKGE